MTSTAKQAMQARRKLLRQRQEVREGKKVAVCVVCGRLLKDAESVRRGIGPVCWGRVKGY